MLLCKDRKNHGKILWSKEKPPRETLFSLAQKLFSPQQFLSSPYEFGRKEANGTRKRHVWRAAAKMSTPQRSIKHSRQEPSTNITLTQPDYFECVLRKPCDPTFRCHFFNFLSDIWNETV